MVAFDCYTLGEECTDIATRERVEREVNDFMTLIDNAVSTLSEEFPSLEGLVSEHVDGVMGVTPALGEWLDHIQIDQ